MDDYRKYNVGNSNYAKYSIQPWDIWKEYNLNPWDADIVKRVLREKDGDSRMLDYEKIVHICKERINHLKTGYVFEKKLITEDIMAEKKFNFSFTSGEVMYTSVRKSASGYNYATVGIKRGDDQFVNVDYEWKGKNVPDFAMDMLGFMQASKEEIEKASKEMSDEYKEFAKRLNDK